MSLILDQSTKSLPSEAGLATDFFGKLYFNEGLSLARAGEYEHAVARLEQSAILCPERTMPLIVLAKLAFYRGEIARCRWYLERCTDRPDVDLRQVTILTNAVEARLSQVARPGEVRATLIAAKAGASRIATTLRASGPTLRLHKSEVLLVIAVILVWVLALLVGTTQ